jgi:predicted PurR-regulated permease PerM
MELTVVGFVIVVALYFGQALFVPLALAVILSFILAPPVRMLRRLGLPRPPAVLVVVVLAFAVIFGVGALITQQVTTLADQLPQYQSTLKDKIKTLRHFTEGSGAFEQASKTLKNLQDEIDKPDVAVQQPAPVTVTPLRNNLLGANTKPLPVEVHTPAPTAMDQLQAIIGIVIAPLATTGVVILFVLFLLLQREDVRDRAIRLLGSHDLEKSTAAMDDAGERLSQYFLAQTFINAAYGLAVGLALWAIGVPSPILWGAVAMLMRFVPFIGSFIAAALPLLLAAAVDPGWTMFLWTAAIFTIGEVTMGNIIEPYVQGQQTGLSPLAILLSAAFWTLLWGPIGLLLAIPLTVVLVVLGHHVERLEFLNVILGDTPPLTPPERFYQRMLAGDPAEPVEQAERILKNGSLFTYYEDIVLEGLRLAQADVDRETLAPDRLNDIRDTAEIVVDLLSDHELRRGPDEAQAAEKTAESAAGDAETDADQPVLAADFDAEQIPAQWRNENAILIVANRTPLDETAALVLAQLLGKCGLSAKVLGTGEAKLGDLRRDYLDGIQLVCLSALDVGERSAHVRFFVRRLRRAAPEAILMGGFWKLDPETRRGKEVIDRVSVDKVVTSLRDAVAFCVQAAMASAEPAPAEPHDEPPRGAALAATGAPAEQHPA